MWDICQKISSWLPDVKRLHGYILIVSAKSSQCKIVKMQARSCWIWSGWSVDPAHKKIRSRLCIRKYKTKRQDKIQRALLASQLFFAMPPLEVVLVLVSIMMSAGWSIKVIHWSWDTKTSAERISKGQSIYISVFQQKADRNMVQTKVVRLINIMCGNQDAPHIWQLDWVNMICRELRGFRRRERGASLFHTSQIKIQRKTREH